MSNVSSIETDGPGINSGATTSVVINCADTSDSVSSCVGCPD